ncbi:hypothetical protein [Streptomyces yangpuensis]|uniref:hypothetical protein n=1 Tax=Streptomyces yangpuensis TaxID=1648182 RepID=UPI00062936E1|nr:hypothetical protein [Streptomyces yangpuensis]
MTAQPTPEPEPERTPRNAEGIAAALPGAQRMEFCRELLAATPEQARGVLLRPGRPLVVRLRRRGRTQPPRRARPREPLDGVAHWPGIGWSACGNWLAGA